MGRLGHVIELMHAARERYSMLEFDLHIRVDDDLLIEREGSVPGADPLGVREDDVKVWVASPWRWRMRFEGQIHTHQQGRDGDRWWSTDPNGLTTGVAGRTGVEGPLGEVQPFEELWDPALLIAELWLDPGGQTETAGRTGIAVKATPRPTPRPNGLDFILLEWPGGDRHELIVDLELGVLLRLASFWRGREIVREEVTTMEAGGSVSEGFFGRRI